METRAQRILLVGPLPPLPGGGSISRAGLLRAFAAAGREVAGLSPITFDSIAAGDRFAAENPDVRMVRYGVERYTSSFPPPEGASLQRWRGEVEALRDLGGRVAEAFRPDVFVAGREDIAATVVDLAEAAGRPAVTLVRGAPTVHLLQGRYDPIWAKRVLSAFERSEAIVAVADYLADGLRGLGFDSVYTAHNAVSPTLFRPRPPDRELLARLGVPDSRPIVLYVGRIASNKRPLDILAAAGIARAQGVETTVVFCGDGPLEQDCLREAEAIGASLHVTGWLGQDDVAKLTASADVSVLASDGEGASRALMEGMSAERCVLSSDTVSAREIIRDRENGLLFRLGDPADLAARLVEALGDADLRRKLGLEARRSLAWRRPEYAVEAHLAAFDDAVRRHHLRSEARVAKRGFIPWQNPTKEVR